MGKKRSGIITFILAASLTAAALFACAPEPENIYTTAASETENAGATLPSEETAESDPGSDDRETTADAADDTDNSGEGLIDGKTEDELTEGLLKLYPQIFLVTGADTLNVRERPTTDAAVIGRLSRYAGGNILSKAGEWYKIRSGRIQGYIHGDYVIVSDRAYLEALSHLKPSEEENGETVYALDVAFTVEVEETTETPRETAKPTASPVPSGWTPVSELPSVPVFEPTGTPNGHTVCIDPGHQERGISETEPNGPGSTVMKAKLSTGTQGATKKEYEVNLEVSMKLLAVLRARGYRVVMIRTTHQCPISNKVRAEIANASGAETFIRVHCNGNDDPAVAGAIAYSPSNSNVYLASHEGLIANSIRLSQALVNGLCAKTGAQNRGVYYSDTMTGINWCTIPVTIMEMGFMTNPEEDANLSSSAYQDLLAAGMADGIDHFFGR